MSTHEAIESLFASFTVFLSLEWIAWRQPYNVIASVRAAWLASVEDTSRIFIEAGFQVWLVFFVVKPGVANVNGQAAPRRRFSDLDNLSPEEQVNLV